MMAKNKILAKASKEKECHWLNSKSDNGTRNIAPKIVW